MGINDSGVDIKVWAKRMRENDPDGSKADVLAAKYTERTDAEKGNNNPCSSASAGYVQCCGQCDFFHEGDCSANALFPNSTFARGPGMRKKMDSKAGRNCPCFKRT